MLVYKMRDTHKKFKYNLNLPLEYSMDCKRRHYWIFSKHANFGKTRTCDAILENYRACAYKCGKDFQEIKPDMDILTFD